MLTQAGWIALGPSPHCFYGCFFPDYTREVQLQRQSFMGVKRKLKELGYTYMLLFQAKLKVLHAGHSHFFQTPEAVWDRLELGDGVGTPRTQSRGAREQSAKMGNIQSSLRRTTGRCHATRGAKVMVRSDGTLSLDGRRQEREEARFLVQSVTAEVSPRSGSPREYGGLTQDSDSTNA
ncbi:hypothetical protein NDU88_003490 [Pleurodeles waltl]|uniref:Uncharacterized protein n=1 Tax=Pleurodeles waltl TaxID=8319 RepID=A0AAV7UC70_PLEWA|nr:hypothetical protein NDU88_003490 [Pleurodeles waltl]